MNITGDNMFTAGMTCNFVAQGNGLSANTLGTHVTHKNFLIGASHLFWDRKTPAVAGYWDVDHKQIPKM
jgi:hypothetical protein